MVVGTLSCVFLDTAGSSKAGVDMLTKVMGLELGPHKVSLPVVKFLYSMYCASHSEIQYTKQTRHVSMHASI